MAFRRRFSGGSPGASTSTQRAKIFWDASREKYLIAVNITDDNYAEFKRDLQLICDSTFWCGKDEPYWAVSESDLDKAKACVGAVWPDFEFVEKPQSHSNGNGGGYSASANNAVLEMFRAAGYETSKKIYSMLIVQYKEAFNNVNAPREMVEKAQIITAGWRQIKQQLGW